MHTWSAMAQTISIPSLPELPVSIVELILKAQKYMNVEDNFNSQRCSGKTGKSKPMGNKEVVIWEDRQEQEEKDQNKPRRGGGHLKNRRTDKRENTPPRRGGL